MERVYGGIGCECVEEFGLYCQVRNSGRSEITETEMETRRETELRVGNVLSVDSSLASAYVLCPVLGLKVVPDFRVDGGQRSEVT